MENTGNKLNFFTTTRFLWKYMRDMKLRYFLFYIGWLFQTIVGVVTPIIFGIMINQIVYYNDLKSFISIGLVFLYVTVFGIILFYMIYEMYACVWNGINRGLRVAMFDQLQRLSAHRMSSLQHGDTVNMLCFQSTIGVNFVIRNIVHNANNIFRIVLCIVIILLINPVFGFVTVVMVPASVIATFKISNRIRRNSEKSRDKYSKYISWLFEVADQLSELKLWGAEHIILRKYDNRIKELNQLNARIEMDNVKGSEVIDNIKNIVLIVQYGLLAYYAIYGDLKIGLITVMLTYFNMLSSSLSNLVRNSMDAQERIAIIDKIHNFLEMDRNEQAAGEIDLKDKIREISFENCSFGYCESQNLILDSVSFSIHSGEKIAVVGSSGAGKSTLLNLMIGLYEPVKGRILINGNDMTQYSKSSLYDHISVVFQQVLLFKGTIRENLQMGEMITEADLIQSCSAAGIYEYILQQENGFDTVMKRWGENLSGGQRQRLGIARAYLRKSDLVIMDEATSALDQENEKYILENWDQVLHDRTCIVVSHRLNTVMRCDRIILLKDGQVHSVGTPEEMREQSKEFRELFAL